MKISYILPITQDTGIRLINTSVALKHLADTFDSVISQSIPNWELIIVVEKNLEKKVVEIWQKVSIRGYLLAHSTNNSALDIRILTVKTKNAAAACNKALELCKGKFIGVIQAGDKLSEVTTYELIKALVENPKAQFIYTDHDHINLQGQRVKPFFKPSLSPDLLYCQNYINNFILIKKTLLKKVGGWNIKYSAAYDYELNLNAISALIKLDRPNPKLLNNQSPIKHIPRILYHRRINIKGHTNNSLLLDIKIRGVDQSKQSEHGLGSIKSFFKSHGRKVSTYQIQPKLYRHQWIIPKPEPLVSLIIPTRDGYKILKTCVQSILKKTTYTNYEILVIDNQTTDIKTIEYMHKLKRIYDNVRILKYNKEFNFSAINNFAVTKAKGSIIGLINNDTQIITPEWLNEMVGHALRPEIGCVGAMLYYPDKTIQHAGVIVGMHGVADHAFKRLRKNKRNDYFNYLISIRNPRAVTAAALIMRKSLFSSVGGFDDINLKISFNDVDLCLKILNLGFWNVWTPYSSLSHFESKSRRSKTLSEQLEAKYLKQLYKIESMPIHDTWN